MEVDDTAPAPATESAPELAPTASAPLDLDAIQRDLADVEVALARLDAGTYWTDEVTGQQLSTELLAQHPTTRRVLAE
jgi:RNA polymerase-binding transcription factor DksA